MHKKIIIGSDHAGYKLKEFIKDFLLKNGYDVKDVGTNSEQSCDYPDYAHLVAKAVSKMDYEKGILICGTANGVCMTANKYFEIRAALCWNKEIAHCARSHNDANIICLPSRFVDDIEAREMVDIFLNTSFDGGRHATRILKIPIKD